MPNLSPRYLTTEGIELTTAFDPADLTVCFGTNFLAARAVPGTGKTRAVIKIIGSNKNILFTTLYFNPATVIYQ